MTDYERMHGLWEVLKLEQDGRSAADAALLKKVLFKDDKVYFRYWLPSSKEFGDVEAGVFSLDPSKTPKLFDLAGTEPPSIHLGIYRLEEDTLELCWSRTPGNVRPTDFITMEGSNRRLMVLEFIPQMPP